MVLYLFLIFNLLFIGMYFISKGNIIKKLGEKGYKILIPIYGEVLMYRLAGMNIKFYLMSLLPNLSLFFITNVYYFWTIAIITGVIRIYVVFNRNEELLNKVYGTQNIAGMLSVLFQKIVFILLFINSLFKNDENKKRRKTNKLARTISLILAIIIIFSVIFNINVYAIDESPSNDSSCTHPNVYYTFSQGIPCGEIKEPIQDTIFKMCSDCNLSEVYKTVKRSDIHGNISIIVDEIEYCLKCGKAIDLSVTEYIHPKVLPQYIRSYIDINNIPVIHNGRELSKKEKSSLIGGIPVCENNDHKFATFYGNNGDTLWQYNFCYDCHFEYVNIMPEESYDTIEERNILAKNYRARQFFIEHNLSFEGYEKIEKKIVEKSKKNVTKQEDKSQISNEEKIILRIKENRKNILNNKWIIYDVNKCENVNASIEDLINVDKDGLCIDTHNRRTSSYIIQGEYLCFIDACFDCLDQKITTIPEAYYDTLEERKELSKNSVVRAFFDKMGLSYEDEKYIEKKENNQNISKDESIKTPEQLKQEEYDNETQKRREETEYLDKFIPKFLDMTSIQIFDSTLLESDLGGVMMKILGIAGLQPVVKIVKINHYLWKILGLSLDVYRREIVDEEVYKQVAVLAAEITIEVVDFMGITNFILGDKIKYAIADKTINLVTDLIKDYANNGIGKNLNSILEMIAH